MRRVDFEIYGLSVDALIVSCYSRCLILDLVSNLGEVVESTPWNMEEFSPFLLSCYARGCMGDMDFVVVGFVIAWKVDQLEDKRSTGDDAASSGEEISTNDVLKYRRLSG